MIRRKNNTNKLKIKEEEQIFNEVEPLNEETEVAQEKVNEFLGEQEVDINVNQQENEQEIVQEYSNNEVENQQVVNKQDEPKETKKIVVGEVKIKDLLNTLDKKTKILYYFLLFLTFGFLRQTIKSRIESNTENVIKTSSNVPFNIAVFMNALGTKENIISVSATISSVKVTLKDIDLVDQQKIKEVSQRGILISDNKITIIFGNFSQTLKELIEKEIK